MKLDLYMEGLTKDYGSSTSKYASNIKQKDIRSSFKLEDLSVGLIVIDGYTDEDADILKIEDNLIEVYMRADRKFLKENGKTKGISCKSLFTIDNFNKRFITKK